MIRLLNLILFSTTLMFSTTSFSQPIVILEYRGSNNQNLSEDISNNIFMMDPDHTEKHTVPKGQSLSEIIDDYYSGSGLDKRFLKLAIVAANPRAFAQQNPNFMFAGATLHLPSLNQIQAMVLGIPINENLKSIKKQADNREIFFFGG